MARHILPTVHAPERERVMTYPLANCSRKKPRRWPLVLRFSKGSIHSAILLPVLTHALITALVVYVNNYITTDFSLPASIIPSLSIVVGLILVFRNQTAFARFWDGRLHFNTLTTAVRTISRQITVLAPPPPIVDSDSDSYPPTTATLSAQNSFGTKLSQSKQHESSLFGSQDWSDPTLTVQEEDAVQTAQTVKILIAMLYTVKNHLRADWGVALSPGTKITEYGQSTTSPEYKELLPPRLRGFEHRGLGLTLELATFVEQYIARGVKKGWFHNAAAAAMLGSLNQLTDAYGKMEVIRLVPIPVAHLIHTRQTLGLFCTIMPFAMVAEMGWWAVPLVAFVAFTLYGIEGIATTFEDPFGVAKIDINMDDIVEDTRREVEVLLDVWLSQGQNKKDSVNINTKQKQQEGVGGEKLITKMNIKMPTGMFISRNPSFTSLAGQTPVMSVPEIRLPQSKQAWKKAFSLDSDSDEDEDDEDEDDNDDTLFPNDEPTTQVKWGGVTEASPPKHTTPIIVHPGDPYGTFSESNEPTPRSRRPGQGTSTSMSAIGE